MARLNADEFRKPVKNTAAKRAPGFRVEHLLKLCAEVRFERFRSCIVYIVVVADGDPENDIRTERQLQDIAVKSPTETRIRFYRLNKLKAKFEM